MKKYQNDFNEAECKQVANALKIKKFAKDKRIFKTGDKANKYYVIVRGQVGILYPKATVYEYQKNGNFDTNVIGVRAKYVDTLIQEQTFVTTKIEQVIDSPNKEL